MSKKNPEVTKNIIRNRPVLGHCVSAMVSLALLADAIANLFFAKTLASEMMTVGFSPDKAFPIGIIIVICLVLYNMPRTALLGAVLITAFFGGAISVHFRVDGLGSPPQFIALALAMAAWLGIYLRDQRVRELLPLWR
jgi:hypothetical protein